MNEATNWIPGLVVLAVGIGGAILFMLFGRKGADDEAPKSDDLTARYEALLTQLRQHIANKHLLPEALWLKQKSDLEQAAAAVLKQRAEKGSRAAPAKGAKAKEKAPATAATAAAAPAAGGGGSTLRGALIGGAVVLFVMVVAWQLSAASTDRQDGQGMSGGAPMQQQAGDQGGAPSLANEAKLREKIAAVRKNPDDVDALAEAAVYMMRGQAFDEARPFVNRALSIDPYNPRARIGRAVLEAVDGNAQKSMQDLEHLSSAYPEAYDASLFAGLIAMEAKDNGRAMRNLERYIAMAPPGEAPPFLGMAVMQMKQQMAGGGAPMMAP